MIPAVAALALMLLCGVFGLVFVLMRLRYRQRLRARLEPGYYPATRDLGNALHGLQMLARPEIAHVMRVKQAEPAEDDEGGDDNDGHER